MKSSKTLNSPELKELHSNNLIKYFSDLQTLCDKWDPINNKVSYRDFTNEKGSLEGIGPVTAIEKLEQKVFDYSSENPVKITKDFAGLYLFIKNEKPFYCGISRNVIKRILDHQKGSTSSMATLAHRIAKTKHSDTSSESYKKAFDQEREDLINCDISFIKFYDQDKEEYEQNNFAQHKEEIMLYLFEVFVSVKYDTDHNSFRTH